MKQGLTEKQKKLLEWTKTFIKKNGFSPSYNEAARSFRISTSAIQDRYKSLENRGWIRKGKGRRTIAIVEE